MKNFYRSSLWSFLLILLSSAVALAQTTVSGKVTDEAGDPLPGANILVKGTQSGTVSNTDGTFSFPVSSPPPFTIVVSYTGYTTREVAVSSMTTGITVALVEGTMLGQEVVVSATRVEQNILESPVTIEKVGLVAIQQTPAVEFYDALANVKGVQFTQSSFNFPQVNTRGFATIANTRFVQMIDGIDTQAPLLNFPTGNIVGIGELDAESMELLPGAASALYGPNAFNGILIMRSLSPFDMNHQGLSAQSKVGMTYSDAQGESNPMYNFGVRYAKAWSRFAFKINASYLKATDWKGNDYQNDINRINDGIDYSRTPDFDGVNLYGDEAEIATPVPTVGVIHRTGFREEAILDSYDAKSIKGDIALHYKVKDNTELIYNFRIGGGNSVYQGSQKYALRNFTQQFHKLELKGQNYFVRTYVTATDAGDSYNVGALGAYMNEEYNPTVPGEGDTGPGWATEYVLAMQGYIPGVPGGSHDHARAYADRDRPAEGTAEFRQLTETVRNRFFQQQPTPGARFKDNSRLYHAEFNYNFADLVKFAEIQVGGNLRRYSLFSDGTIFNEAPEGGSPERIDIDEYGIYTQVAKKINDLALTGSVRYDKNQNFEGRITPRVSAVYTFNNTHNIRASFQTGFRNPDTQAQYIYFPAGLNTLLGSSKENAERYGVHLGGAYSRASYDAYRASGGRILADGTPEGGNQALLQTDYVDYIKPERLVSYELGYKSVIGKHIMIDLNGYFTEYKDFIGGDDVVSKAPTQHKGEDVPAGKIYSPYRNESERVTSSGIGVGLTYTFLKGFAINGNYNWATFNVDDDGSSTFRAGFNTPENKLNIGLSKTPRGNSLLGFSLNYRWQESFLWQSDFGDWTVPEFGVFDAQVSYKVPSMKSLFKLGGTNLLGGDYRTNFGGPFVGQTYYISITFDQAFK